MTNLQRIYVHEEIYEKLKSAKDHYDESMAELSREAVGSYFDEEGRRKEARLSEETLNRNQGHIGKAPEDPQTKL